MNISLSKMYMDDEIKGAVNDILTSGYYIKGQNLRSFESEFAQAFNVEYAIGVSSGTSAILLAMMALGVKKGDEVIVPSHTFIATASPAKFLGADIVYADIDPDTYTISPDDIAEKITDKTKAVIPVHLYGHAADMDAIMSIADEHNGVSVVEDACQAHGGLYKGKNVGSIGDLACFSFFPSKNMTVGGDGGMVTTNNEELAGKVSVRRDHGRRDKYVHDVLGLNLRLNEIQAAIGRIQLKHLPDWVETRRDIASRYNQMLGDVVETPKEQSWTKHVYYVYTIQSDDRDGLAKHLNDSGIATGIYYPVPVHRQPCMEAEDVSLPLTERCVDRILSLPMHPQLNDNEVEYIASKVIEFEGK